MRKPVTVVLKNNLVVSGILIEQTQDAVTVRVDKPYYVKRYLDSSCNQTDEVMSSGVKKVIYNSHKSELIKKKDFTLATIKLVNVAKMK